MKGFSFAGTPAHPLRRALVLGVLTALLLQGTLLAHECSGIRQNVLRLHILAATNNCRDQLLKLKVRDRLLAESAPLLRQVKSRQQALAITGEQLPRLTAAAEETLRQYGCTLPVVCRLQRDYFTTRRYAAGTLPAGEYAALQVSIGAGQGNNWWCVMFPPLCLPAAEEETDWPPALNEAQTDLIENGERYRVKFKIVEWVESLLAHCRDWFE